MAKFKIGDRVTVVDNGRLTVSQEEYIGANGVVQDSDDIPDVKMDIDGKIWSFDQDKLKLAEVEPRFKVGQKVTVVDQSTLNKNQRKYIGKSFVITSVRTGCHDGKIRYNLKNAGYAVYFEEVLKEAEETMEFKVGDKVVIVDRENGYGLDCHYHDGDKATIKSVYWKGDISLRMYDGNRQIVKPSQIKLDTLTKAEALKAAIDGQKVQSLEWCSGNDRSYVFFNGVEFRFTAEGEPDRTDVKANAAVNYDQWRIYGEPTVQPKFSKGNLFVNQNGRIGKVLEEPKNVEGNYVYTVSFNFKDCHSRVNDYPEKFMETEFRED